ncbi:MAG: hypothetical protein V7K39_24620 [Nostoc sp.]
MTIDEETEREDMVTQSVKRRGNAIKELSASLLCLCLSTPLHPVYSLA